MPRGNRQGPDGAGPMTGRAMGYCAGYETAGFENPLGGVAGRGLGLGFGRRFGGRGLSGFGAGRRGGGFRGAGGFGVGRGRTAVYGGRFGAGLGQAYWNEGVETPETRDALLREEIDLLSNRLEALKHELDAGTKGPEAPSEDE